MWVRPHQVEGVTSEEKSLRRLAVVQSVSSSSVLAQSVKRLGVIVLTQLGLELGGAGWRLWSCDLVTYAVRKLDRPAE